MIEVQHPSLPVTRQCAVIDAQFMETPFYGSRQMARHLRNQNYCVGRKRVRRLMAKMGLLAVYQRPRTTVQHPEHRKWPYLLRDLAIDRPNHVWCAALWAGIAPPLTPERLLQHRPEHLEIHRRRQRLQSGDLRQRVRDRPEPHLTRHRLAPGDLRGIKSRSNVQGEVSGSVPLTPSAFAALLKPARKVAKRG